MLRSWTLATLVVATFVITIVPVSEQSGLYAEIPTECPKIDSPGETVHLPHEWDCTKFYYCDHGNRVLFECPVMDTQGNRLHFDPVTQLCEWPEDAGCVDGQSPTSSEGTTGGSSTQASTITVSTVSSTWPFTSTVSTSTSVTGSPTSTTVTTPVVTGDVIQNGTVTPSGHFIPHETNCSLFWEIVNGEKILRECPAGQEFSPTEEICDWPDKAGCQITTPISVETTTSSGPTCGIPCGDISHGTAVPHECVCEKYYRCSNGDLILQKCPAGLHFNPKIYGCDWPASAGCLTTTENPITDQTTPGSTFPTECPAENPGHAVQIPHPTNCSLYYKCENGQKILSECPDDLHFNPVLQMCDWADSAGCVATTFPGDSTTGRPTSTVRPPPQADCPPDNSGPVVHLPYPYNCTLFYRCDNGDKILESCPPGLEFNAEEQVCDWPEVAGCTASTWVSDSTTQPTRPSTTGEPTRPSTTSEPTRPSTTSEPTRPSTTSEPTRPSTTSRPTRPSTTSEPTRPSTTSEPTRPSTTSEPTRPSTTSEPTRPSTTSEPTSEPTRPSTTSEPTRPSTTSEPTRPSTTSEPTRPSTTSEPTRPSTTSEPTRPSTTSEPTRPSTTSEPTRPSTTESTTPPTTTTDLDTTTAALPTDCPPDNSGPSVHLPYPYNCSLYYRCDNGDKMLESCPPGLEFNAAEQVCDWPEFAGCTASTWVSESTTQPTRPSTTSEPTRPSTTSEPTRPSTTSEPTRPSTTSEPTRPSTTIEPTRPSTTSRPTRPSTTSEPTRPSTTSEPTRPSTTSRPTRPSTTSEPTRPSTTSEPTRPSTTSEPTRPSTTSEPTRPSTTSEPTRPSTTSEPTRPSTTSEPTRPSTTSEPTRPSTTSEPTRPSTTSEPTRPSTTSEPTRPSTTSRPTRPSTTTEPTRPSTTSEPTRPSTTSEPTRPSTTSEPTRPSTTSEPTRPSTTSEPTRPSTTSEPTRPSTTSEPTRPSTTSEPTRPSTTSEPTRPSTTSEPTRPSTTSEPTRPSTTSEPTRPSTTSEPTRPSTTSEPTRPSTTSEPTRPSTTSEPTRPSTTSEPTRPSTTSEPTRPSTTSEPTRPSTTSEPTRPSTTSEPTRPSTTSEPTRPSTTSEPTRPSTTSEPTRPSTTSEPTRPSTTSEPTRPPTTTTDLDTTTAALPTDCPPDNSGPPVHLPYPYNCSLYYRCDNGEKIVESCSAELEFNPETRECDWPENAGCVVSTTEDPQTTWSTWITPWTTSSRPLTTTLSTSTSIPDFECPPGVSGIQKPHETNCSLYYECNNGNKELKQCVPGLHFSPVLEICDWPENAGCEAITNTPDPSTNPNTVVTSAPTSANFTDDFAGEDTSPTTVKLTTTERPTTQDPAFITCIGTCPNKDPEEYTVLLPNEDCTKFCKCSNSRPYVYDCPAKLHFSPVKFVCDYPRRAKCQGRGGSGRLETELFNN